MKLKDQVCSLELSKKLKELGINQESLFYLVRGYAYNDPEIGGDSWSIIDADELKGTISYQKQEHISAFTVAELVSILPCEVIDLNDYRFELTICKKIYGFECSYSSDIGNLKYFTCDKLEDSLAKMLIYLFENKLICN